MPSPTIAVLEALLASATPEADRPPPPSEAQEEQPALDLSVTYTADVWGNVRGGRRRGLRYLDNLDVTLTIDSEKALGWPGGTIFIYGLYNNGESLSEELIGDVQVASNIDAGVQAARLYEAWVEQRLIGDRLSLKAGLYDLNSEFDTSDSAGLFLNSSHGIGPDFSQSGENGPSIFPVTSLAVRAEYELSDRWLARAAVLDGVPGDPRAPRRTAIQLGGGDGALVVGEFSYLDDRTKLAVGAWRYTAKFEDILATQLAAEPVERRGNDGLYALAERKLWNETADSGQGLSGWLRFGLADPRFNPIRSYLGGGLVYTGPLAARDQDQFGVAVARVRFGERYLKTAVLAGQALEAGETNIEITYRMPLTPWLTLQPDLQYVLDPGGVPGRRNAFAIGLRTEIGF